MKLIGINPATRQLRWPIKSPYRVRLRLRDQNGASLPLTARDLAMTIYRDLTVIRSVAGIIATDATGDYATFAFDGDIFDGETAPALAAWEIAEIFTTGKTPMLAGAVVIAPAASSALGDGDYQAEGTLDDLAWSPALDTVIVVATGAPGKTGPSGAESFIQRVAGEAIGGHRAVRVDASGTAWLARPDQASALDTMGISDAAANVGALVQIRALGEANEAGWAWSAGPVWVGANGVLTQALPTSGYLIRIGTAVGPSAISVAPHVIAKL